MVCCSSVPGTVSGDASSPPHGCAGHQARYEQSARRCGNVGRCQRVSPWHKEHRPLPPMHCPLRKRPPASDMGRQAALGRAGSVAGATRAWYEAVLHWLAASVCPRPLPVCTPWSGGLPSGFLMEQDIASALCPCRLRMTAGRGKFFFVFLLRRRRLTASGELRATARTTAA
jgi:hypothetical protein